MAWGGPNPAKKRTFPEKYLVLNRLGGITAFVHSLPMMKC